jgi:hypothetical protein
VTERTAAGTAVRCYGAGCLPEEAEAAHGRELEERARRSVLLAAIPADELARLEQIAGRQRARARLGRVIDE